MTFVHPLWLFFALAPLHGSHSVGARTARRLPLLLKAASFAAALNRVCRAHAAVAAHQSWRSCLGGYVRQRDARRLEARFFAMVQQIESERGSNWMKVVPFAAKPRLLTANELAKGVHLSTSASPAGDSTNIEAALAGSMAAVPAGYIPRLVLISDGNENEGSSARAIAQMRRLQVPVDTIAIEGRPTTDLRLDSLSIPHVAYAGEQIPLDLTIHSPAAAARRWMLPWKVKPLGSNTVQLEAGVNTLRVHARLEHHRRHLHFRRVSAPRIRRTCLSSKPLPCAVPKSSIFQKIRPAAIPTCCTFSNKGPLM